MVDNSAFICEHDLLAVDPNSPLDFDSTLAIIKRSDWDVLETLQVHQVMPHFVEPAKLLP
jgi:ubiquitin carboxyl-terminal hydrolase 48